MKNDNIKSVKERSIIKPLIITIGIVGIFFLGFLLFSGEEKQSTQLGAVNPIPTPASIVRIAQPSVDSASWKTYVDPVVKYSIKYPVNIIPSDGGRKGVGVLFHFTDYDPNKMTAAHNNYENLIITPRNETGKDASYGFTQGKYIRISLNNAYGIDASINGNYDILLNDTNKSGDVIEIALLNFPTADPNKMETLRQMVRTFRFSR